MLGALLLFALALGLHVLSLFVTGNIHEVVKDEIFRSAQLDARALEKLIADEKIKTIINLRGAGTGQKWYEDEKATAEKHGVKLIDFRLSAIRLIQPERALELLSLYRTAEKPILIHCKAGADRSGFASALYVIGIAKQPEKKAETQLSIRYGHFSIPFLGEYNMDRSFETIGSRLANVEG